MCGLLRIRISDRFHYLIVNGRDRLGIIDDIRMNFTHLYNTIFLQDDRINFKICTSLEKQILPPIYEDDKYTKAMYDCINTYLYSYADRSHKQVVFEINLSTDSYISSLNTCIIPKNTPSTVSSNSTVITSSAYSTTTSLINVHEFVLYNSAVYVTNPILNHYVSHLQSNPDYYCSSNNITMFPDNDYLYATCCMSGRLFIQQSLHTTMIAHQQPSQIRNFMVLTFEKNKAYAYWPATIDMIKLVDNRIVDNGSNGMKIYDGYYVYHIRDNEIDYNAMVHLLRSICQVQIGDIYQMLNNHILSTVTKRVTNHYKSLLLLEDHNKNIDNEVDDDFDSNNDTVDKSKTPSCLNHCNHLLGLSSSQHTVSDIIQAIFKHTEIDYTLIGIQLTQVLIYNKFR